MSFRIFGRGFSGSEVILKIIIINNSKNINILINNK